MNEPKLKVLIVDDDEEFLEPFCWNLKACGARPDSLPPGVLLRRIKRGLLAVHDFDVILVDVYSNDGTDPRDVLLALSAAIKERQSEFPADLPAIPQVILCSVFADTYSLMNWTREHTVFENATAVSKLIILQHMRNAFGLRDPFDALAKEERNENRPAQKRKVIFVDDNEIGRDLSVKKAGRIGLIAESFSPGAFRNYLRGGRLSDNPFDVLYIDIMNDEGLDITKILARLSADVMSFMAFAVNRPEEAWAGRDLPKIVFFSAAGIDEINRRIAWTKENTCFEDIEGVTQPVMIEPLLRRTAFPSSFLDGTSEALKISDDKPALKPKVLLVDDNPDNREEFVDPKLDFAKYFRTMACSPHNFSGVIIREHTREDPFAVVVHDLFLANFIGNMSDLANRHDDLANAGDRNDNTLLPPAILVNSRARQNEIESAVKQLRWMEYFDLIEGMRAPTAPEMISMISRLAARLKSSEDVMLGTGGETEPVTLSRVLEDFEKYKKICRRSEANDPEREKAEKAFCKNYLSLDPEAMTLPYRLTVSEADKEMASVLFPASVGKTMAGLLAFSQDDIVRLRATDETTPVILVAQNPGPDSFGQISCAQGIIVLGKAAIHFGQIVRSKGLAGLLIEEEQAEQIGLEITRDGSTPFLSCDGEKPFVLRSGDWATIDTNSNRLYAGRPEIVLPDLPPLYWEFVYYAREVLGRPEVAELSGFEMPSNLDFSVQADQPEDMEVGRDPIGLSRVENYYLEEPNRAILFKALEDPSKQNLLDLYYCTEMYLKNLILYQRKIYHNCERNSITVRLMDFKPDQLLSPEQNEALKKKYGLDDLRGFALAHKAPEVYQAQVKGIAYALPLFLHENSSVRFAVPRAETPEDIARAIEIIGDSKIVLESSRSKTYIIPQICPTIETKIGARNAFDLIKACIESGKDEDVYVKVLLGTGDLTTDIIGIERNELGLIQKYMEERPDSGSPFLTLFPELTDELQKVADAARSISDKPESCGKHIAQAHLIICGDHATYLPNYAQFSEMGVFEVCVPAKMLYIRGLPDAHMFQNSQRFLRRDPLRRMPKP
ncbi:MAG: hypothetical protein PHY92_02170 [Alphaproteobacteria bacterium]|nr:hypothetical protein [Alphaproteobacteria bacterium]